MQGELILTRSEGETVILETSDGPVCVIVRELRGARVRLGFVAPPDVLVMRGELDRGQGETFDHDFRDGGGR
jgi:sRNA-binding carbon storage regulator CsrA